MAKQAHHTVLHRLFCLLMALHVINMSVDAPDGYARRALQGEQREDLSVNDMESLSELVLEECLGMTDAVPEHDEPDDNSSLTEFEEEYIATLSFVFAPFSTPAHSLVVTKLLPFQTTHVPTPVVEIVAPPPRHMA
ncbi:hypothetical protein [Spirosoma arcticum]